MLLLFLFKIENFAPYSPYARAYYTRLTYKQTTKYHSVLKVWGGEKKNVASNPLASSGGEREWAQTKAGSIERNDGEKNRKKYA